MCVVRRSWRLALVCLLVVGACTPPRPPSPRPDAAVLPELQRAESLGRRIYDLDRAAALATDELARRGVVARDASVRGWIVEPQDDGWLVRFVAVADGSSRATHDVVVSQSGGTVVQDGPRPRLSQREEAMFRARERALAAIAAPCSTHYNTVVLPEPADAGWIVYVLAATTTSDEVVLGGHHKIRVSPDGRDVIEDVPLSKSCLSVNPRKQVSSGAKARAVWATHLISPTPIETHVFLSLLHRLPLYVGTSLGTWCVEDGHIELVDAAPRR